MIQRKLVLNSDAINRYRMRMSIGALEDALQMKALSGLSSCVGHDMMRPIGWTKPYGLYFEPHLCRVVGIMFIPESSEDKELVNDLHKAAITQRYTEDCEEYVEVVRTILGDKLSDKTKWVSSTCVSFRDEGILERVYPKLFENADKDGLIYLSDLLKSFEHVGQGVFKDKSSRFAVLPHPYFRRSLSVHNNLNYFFLNEFLKHANTPNINLRIALDRDCIGIADTYREAVELEYWRGPKFNSDIAKIKLGVTVHGSDEMYRKFNSISRTEFSWKIEGNEQTFESEEIREHPSLGIGNDQYGCRYIHSIFDASTKTFKHFDGAIRMYGEDQMLQRDAVDIKSAGKNSGYTKLFRIDGQLAIEDWKSLAGHYYQGNPLIHEYFEDVKVEAEGPADEAQFIDEPNEDLLQKYVPYRMKQGDGVRIFVSYQSIEEMNTKRTGRYVSGFDTLTIGEETINIIESDTIEIKKALRRIGEDLVFPEAITYTFSQDSYLGFPTIYHNSIDNIEDSVTKTLEAFKMVIQAFVDKGHDTVIPFTLAWPRENDKTVVVSVMGHCADLLAWLNVNKAIPIERSAFKEWLEKQSKWLKENYTKQIDIPPLFEMCCADGVLFVRRRMISSLIGREFKMSEDKKQVLGSFTFPKELDEEGKAYEDKILRIAPSYIMQQTECSKCGADYKSCEHSKYLDNDVTEVVKKSKGIGLFWTDR